MADTQTFGCRLYIAKSGTARALAARAGWPGALIVNTCSVMGEAQAQARQSIRRAAREQPGRPVTGCAAQIAPLAWAALPRAAAVGGNGRKLNPEAWNAGVAPIEHSAPMGLAADGTTRAFLAVQQGYTFCIIPQGRGPARAMPIAKAVDAARALAARHAEVVLTGVVSASHPALAAPARAGLREVPEVARLRLPSLDPAARDEDFRRGFAEEERLMPNSHRSAQHGHDLILKCVRRRHSRHDLLQLAARACASHPGLALGVVLIAGCPTETEEHLCAMIDLVAEARPALLHVFPCSARAGTPAARRPQLPMALRRGQAARLRAAGDAQRACCLGTRLGRVEQVLMEADGMGHTAHFAPVRVSGARLAARVTRHGGTSLWAEVA